MPGWTQQITREKKLKWEALLRPLYYYEDKSILATNENRILVAIT